jgi:ABC-type nickel/cobalt efflux system permease component RcnA
MTKALGIAVILFFVALGVVVGLRMDDRTASMLSGIAIGLIIGVPCAMLGMQAARGHYNAPQRYTEPPHRQSPPVQPVQHFHYHDNRTVVMTSPLNSQGREAAREMLKDGQEVMR